MENIDFVELQDSESINLCVNVLLCAVYGLMSEVHAAAAATATTAATAFV